MNKTTLIIIIIAIVVLIGIGFLYFAQQPQYMPNNTVNNQPANTQPNQSAVTGNTTTAQTWNISIKNFAFIPANLTIRTGDTVTWINQDTTPHRISGTGFQGDILNVGQKYNFTFTTAGTFDYICSIHPSMKGKIIVQ